MAFKMRGFSPLHQKLDAAIGDDGVRDIRKDLEIKRLFAAMNAASKKLQDLDFHGGEDAYDPKFASAIAEFEKALAAYEAATK